MGIYGTVRSPRKAAGADRPMVRLILLLATVLGIVLGVVAMHGTPVETGPSLGHAASAHTADTSPGAADPTSPGAGLGLSAPVVDSAGCGACGGHAEDGGAALCLLALLVFAAFACLRHGLGEGPRRAGVTVVRLRAVRSRIPPAPDSLALGISRT